MNNNIREGVFWCTEAMLPGLDLAVAPILQYGYGAPEKRPVGKPQFGECQITINCDAKGTQWTFFKKWLEIINNFDTSEGIDGIGGDIGAGLGGTAGINDPYEVSYKEDYLSFAVISMYSDNGDEILTVVLNECYPISLSNLRLDWGQTDSIAKFGVALTYRDWFQTQNAAQIGNGA